MEILIAIVMGKGCALMQANCIDCCIGNSNGTLAGPDLVGGGGGG